MNEKMLAIKSAIAAFGTAVGTLLGWKGIVAGVWVFAMILDYISGSAAACKEGQWSSTAARQGIWHKCGMILVVVVTAIADGVIFVIDDHLPIGFSWPGLLMPLVLIWYILTEAGSVLENAVKLGATVPDWLVKALKISLKVVDDAGDTATGGTDKEE